MKDYHSRREERWQRRADRIHRFRSGNGHVWVGAFLLIIGGVALLKALLLPLPEWLFTWQMLLIALGFFIGVRHQFRNSAWFILMIIGGIFLIKEFFPDLIMQQFLWPLALIVIGIFIIARPRRRHRVWSYKTGDSDNEPDQGPEGDSGSPDAEQFSSADLIDATSVFGGIKKTILSKNFKGGDITNILGGSEINMSQADIQGKAHLDVTQIFGGTKLIIPADWDVKMEMAAVFGGVEDKRPTSHIIPNPNKQLVIDGTSIFGGIEIRTF